MPTIKQYSAGIVGIKPPPLRRPRSIDRFQRKYSGLLTHGFPDTWQIPEHHAYDWATHSGEPVCQPCDALVDGTEVPLRHALGYTLFDSPEYPDTSLTVQTRVAAGRSWFNLSALGRYLDLSREQVRLVFAGACESYRTSLPFNAESQVRTTLVTFGSLDLWAESGLLDFWLGELLVEDLTKTERQRLMYAYSQAIPDVLLSAPTRDLWETYKLNPDLEVPDNPYSPDDSPLVPLAYTLPVDTSDQRAIDAAVDLLECLGFEGNKLRPITGSTLIPLVGYPPEDTMLGPPYTQFRQSLKLARWHPKFARDMQALQGLLKHKAPLLRDWLREHSNIH